MGKSRVALSLAILFTCSKEYPSPETVHVVFSSDILLQTDKAIYDKVKLLGIQINPVVGVHAASIKKNDIVILDEGDRHLLDKREQVPACQGIIALSATACKKSGNEEVYLKQLSYYMLDSQIKTSFQVATALTYTDAEQVFPKDGMGLLVYCSEEDIEKYKALAEKEQLDVHVNLSDIEKIRSLGSNDCILQSKEELMRGVDYNCKPDGLKLLIATDFSSDRSLL